MLIRARVHAPPFRLPVLATPTPRFNGPPRPPPSHVQPHPPLPSPQVFAVTGLTPATVYAAACHSATTGADLHESLTVTCTCGAIISATGVGACPDAGFKLFISATGIGACPDAGFKWALVLFCSPPPRPAMRRSVLCALPLTALLALALAPLRCGCAF
eukprot:scaffold18283_cov91-Isochrysis_galbana.AAC.1